MERYVVEVPFLIPAGRLEPIVAAVSRDLGVPPERIRRVLADRMGPITRPVGRAEAERVGRALRRAGVPAVVAPSVVAPSEVREAFAAPRPAPAPGPSPIPASAPPPSTASADREARLSRLTLAGAVGDGRRAERTGGATAAGVPLDGSENGDEGGDGGEDGGEDGEHFGDGWTFEGPRGSVARRRWWLVGSLVVALAALLALQVLWAAPSPGAAAPGAAPYAAGLTALRRGDFAAARRVWEAAAPDDPRAAYLRGALAERGWGQPWSAAEASRWYRSAARRGHAAAARRLARLYEAGMGVEQSYAEARAWYGRAARAGDAPAAVRLADLLLTGAGGPVDAAGARSWLERAAAAGSLEAEGRLRLLEPAPEPAPGATPSPGAAPRVVAASRS